MHGRRYRAGNDVDQNRPGDLIDRPTAAPAALTRDEEGLLGCFRTDDPISAEELCELWGSDSANFRPCCWDSKWPEPSGSFRGTDI